MRRLARGLGGTGAMLAIAAAALHAQTGDPSAFAAGWVRGRGPSPTASRSTPSTVSSRAGPATCGSPPSTAWSGSMGCASRSTTPPIHPDSPAIGSCRSWRTRDSALWLNTEQRYLIRFKRGRFTHIDESRGLVGGPYAIYEDPSGQLFIGSEQGLGRMEGDRLVPVAPEVIRGRW